jgi:molecular chaperone GrpE (heat shock protein)
MYPGEWALSTTERSNRVNFDDPMSPDYISVSPAFNAHYAKQRAENILREHNERMKSKEKIQAMRSQDSDESLKYTEEKHKRIDQEFERSRQNAERDSAHAKFMCKLLLTIVIVSGLWLWFLMSSHIIS